MGVAYDETRLRSFSLGGIAERDLGQRLRIAAALNFSSKGFVAHLRETSPNSATVTRSDDTVRLHYAELPLTVVFRAQKYFLGAGPYFSYGLSGRKTSTLPGREGTDVKFGNQTSDLYAPFDYGVNFEFGTELARATRLSIIVRQGVANQIPRDAHNFTKSRGFDTHGEHQVIALALTHMFSRR